MRFNIATMPAKTDLSQLNCSLAHTLAKVGDWWTLLIVRDAFLGAKRFNEFQRSLGLARNVLATRLAQLVEGGILERMGSDTRPTYHLTDKGLDLLPALAALMQWGDRWESGGRPPIRLTDDKGRAIVRIGLATSQGEVEPRAVRFVAGSGATPRTRQFIARQNPGAPSKSGAS